VSDTNYYSTPGKSTSLENLTWCFQYRNLCVMSGDQYV